MMLDSEAPLAKRALRASVVVFRAALRKGVSSQSARSSDVPLACLVALCSWKGMPLLARRLTARPQLVRQVWRRAMCAFRDSAGSGRMKGRSLRMVLWLLLLHATL